MWVNNQTEVSIEQFETFKDFAKFCSAFNIEGIWAYLWATLKKEGKIIVTKKEN